MGLNHILIIWCSLFLSFSTSTGVIGITQDQTSSRPNTLLDDADDIQRQLNNEARDRVNLGRPKTIWVFNFPTTIPTITPVGRRLSRRPRDSNDISRIFVRYSDPTSYDDWSYYTNSNLLNTKDSIRMESKFSNFNDDLLKELCLAIGTRLNLKQNNFGIYNYTDQHKWSEKYAECARRSQSPVDLPVEGLIKARGGRELSFANYDATPKSLSLQNDGKRVILFGQWARNEQPLVYGGAAHSRRYLFHCLILHWPSEHTVGGLQYPLETQALHLSAEYNTFQEAVQASTRDPQAFLGIVNIYKFGKTTHSGLNELLRTGLMADLSNNTLTLNPLRFFNPPFRAYACYQGSLTFPPCTESVLWLVRGRALTVTREAVEAVHSQMAADDDIAGELKKFSIRRAQPLNDRKIFWFN